MSSGNSKTAAHMAPPLAALTQNEPYIYHQESSIWRELTHTSPELKRGSVLTIASWNLEWSSPDPSARTYAALAHLKRIFDTEAENLIVMLQEITSPSLRVILEDQWVQHNFILSNITAPESSRTVTLNNQSVLKQSARKASPYFTIMMVSKALPVLGCFRVPLVTNMGRDVLSIDIRYLGGDGKASGSQECIRLCTTHLESLRRGKALRLGQLRVVSDLLKSPMMPGRRVVAGIVGGDMNAIDKSEHDYHRAEGVDLNDAWEDERLRSLREDKCQGKETESTWGCQSPKRKSSNPIDKFLYSGAIETLAVRDPPGAPARFERFGVGLRTEVEAWELEREEIEVTGGQIVRRQHKEWVSEERLNLLEKLGFLKSYKTKALKMDFRVSDHCGIAARVKII